MLYLTNGRYFFVPPPDILPQTLQATTNWAISITEINTYKLHLHFKECPERSIFDFRFELAFQMILNDLHGSISNPEELKNRKRVGKDCGNEWVSIPKFCGKWIGTEWRKVKQ